MNYDAVRRTAERRLASVGPAGDGSVVGHRHGGTRTRGCGGGVVVITGASSGIGRCTAALFARHGWSVGLIARGRPGLEVVRDELTGAGACAAAAVADVSDAAALERAADLVERELGPIGVWVNCAGNGVYGPFVDVPEQEFHRVTEVTYLGTVNGTRAALRRMVPRDAGTVVNVCSAIAYRGMPLLSSYSGAKHAVRGFTGAVRAELAQEGSQVRLVTVFPPAVNTPFFSHAPSHMDLPPRPMRPVYQPEVVAGGILLAATSRRPRREMQVSGITVLFALASKLVPRIMDRAVAMLGYAGQMTDSPEAARLREPTMFALPTQASSVHGPFSEGARRFSVQMWASRNQPTLLAVAAGLGALFAATAVLALRPSLLRRRRRRRRGGPADAG